MQKAPSMGPEKSKRRSSAKRVPSCKMSVDFGVGSCHNLLGTQIEEIGRRTPLSDPDVEINPCLLALVVKMQLD